MKPRCERWDTLCIFRAGWLGEIGSGGENPVQGGSAQVRLHLTYSPF